MRDKVELDVSGEVTPKDPDAWVREDEEVIWFPDSVDSKKFVGLYLNDDFKGENSFASQSKEYIDDDIKYPVRVKRILIEVERV